MLDKQNIRNLINFNLICRFCFKESSTLKSIFDSYISEMLNYCNFVEIQENDGLPDNMCDECSKALNISYDFKQKCISSQKSLQTFLKGNNSTNSISKQKKLETDLDLQHEEEICKHKLYSNISTKLQEVYKATKYNEEQYNLLNFECDKCGILFNSKNELATHEKDVHLIEVKGNGKDKDVCTLKTASKDIHKCEECKESFKENDDLQLHLCLHAKGTPTCTSCGKSFTKTYMLRRHIKIHMIKKPYICQQCGKGFAESCALTKHINKHMGIPRDKKHICKECGQSFSEPFWLRVHLRKHSGERPLVCSYCNKSFSDPRSLKAHHMLHTGEKPHVCHYCQKQFAQSANLKKHLRIHTGERPYVCARCGKSFTQSSSLEKHNRTHTGEKPFACDRCDKRFSEKGTLKHHLKTHR